MGNNISYNEALAYVLNRGFAEYAHELLDPKPSTKMKECTSSPNEPQVAPAKTRRKAAFSTRIIKDCHARISYYYHNRGIATKSLKFNSKESRRIQNAGYRFCREETARDGSASISITKKAGEDSRPIRFYNNGRYVYAYIQEKQGQFPLIKRIESALSFIVNKGESLDVSYTIKEDRECLVFTFKRADKTSY